MAHFGSGCLDVQTMRWEDCGYINQFFGGCDNWHSREQHDGGFHSNGREEEMAPFYQHLHN